MSRTLVVGDVHGCARELRRLIKNVGPDRVILVGDLFTKGPSAGKVWNLIQELNIEAVLGNHDAWLLKIIDGEVEAKPRHTRVINSLNRENDLWIDWLRSLPLYRMEQGFIIVHAGVHPCGKLEETTRDMALLMRHWPMGKLSAPHWYDLYEGEHGVIFGHDAKGGLVYRRRGEQPFIVGLDSGCVYGKKLSGYVIETDELFQVSAAQTYQPIYSF